MLNNTILNSYKELLNYVKEIWFEKNNFFSDNEQEILLTAFIHKSYASDFVPALDHNERLEFLWDSILWSCIATLLYKNYPQWSEAQMTLYKIALVREEMLAQVARDINLWKKIFLSNGEEKQWGRDKDSIIADCFEALLGSCFLLYWYNAVYSFIESNIRKYINELQETNCKSYKSLIQEWSQGNWLALPSYETNETKKDGEIWFITNIIIDGKILGSGEWKNKKQSQEQAAKDAYLRNKK